MKKILCLLAWLFLFQTAFADDYLKICHAYHCKAESTFKISDGERVQLAARFAAAGNAAAEREAVRQAVLAVYLAAGRQTPVYQDKGGNFRDGSSPGRMDCADHSNNDTAFLQYFARNGWLKFHTVGKPVYRAPRFLDLHYAAQLVEKDDGSRWVVDSWFEDFGKPPVVVEYALWKKGWKPEKVVG
ncbi:hypothetical protein [Neisseria perflava]|uniref:hypothetical protein n=1 Tax=Neisseria perflava TaxID=33053 RepID=UPI00209FA33B|nr:hypothetical protein [Neisseria perflava]MCP1661286.1 hypothetical protein [Neisseria perflava]MCP1773227.1 hypothetical protein [Neisseria perflava]